MLTLTLAADIEVGKLEEILTTIVTYLESNRRPITGLANLKDYIVKVITRLIELNVDISVPLEKLLYRLSTTRKEDAAKTKVHYKWLKDQIISSKIVNHDFITRPLEKKLNGNSAVFLEPTRLLICHQDDLVDFEIIQSLTVFFDKYPGECKIAITDAQVKQLCARHSSIKTLHFVAHSIERFFMWGEADQIHAKYGCFEGSKSDIVSKMSLLLKSDELRNVTHLYLAACKSSSGFSTHQLLGESYLKSMRYAKFKVDGESEAVTSRKSDKLTGTETAYFEQGGTVDVSVIFFPSSVAYMIYEQMRGKFTGKYCITAVPQLLEPEIGQKCFVGKSLDSEHKLTLRSIKLCSAAYLKTKQTKWHAVVAAVSIEESKAKLTM